MSKDNNEFEKVLEENIEFVQDVIYKYMPKVEGYQSTVIDAMNYSFMAGGKRLRPIIMLKTYEAFGKNSDIIYPFMAAIEMIHTYSLVHDDLPEMDNDELRRGKPTTHIKYGHAMAVLAGDGLLNYAFETAIKAFNDADINEKEYVAKAISILAEKAGIYGMIGGQTVDVEAEKKQLKLSKDQLLFTYENKTAALLQASLMIGASLAGADDNMIKKLEAVGYDLGIAFQLQDDILDIVGSTEVLGKPVGSDADQNKVTYVSFLGMDKAIEEQKRLSKEAYDILNEIAKEISVSNNINESFDFLTKLIMWLVDRKL